VADDDNSGQFGTQDNMQQQASTGGTMSRGNFKDNPKRASEAGKQGAQNQPTEAKAKGGHNSNKYE
jgi:uncharacterized protein